jgi:hypothetical protein
MGRVVIFTLHLGVAAQVEFAGKSFETVFSLQWAQGLKPGAFQAMGHLDPTCTGAPPRAPPLLDGGLPEFNGANPAQPRVLTVRKCVPVDVIFFAENAGGGGGGGGRKGMVSAVHLDAWWGYTR